MKWKKIGVLLIFLIIISYFAIDKNIDSHFVIGEERSKLIPLPSTVSKISIISDIPINVDIIDSENDYDKFIKGEVFGYYIDFTSSSSAHYEKTINYTNTDTLYLLIFNNHNNGEANVDVRITRNYLRKTDAQRFGGYKDKSGNEYYMTDINKYEKR